MAWVLVWAVYIALDPGVVAALWLILPEPYVEGLKFLASNDTGGSPGLLARRGLDGGQRLVLARHPAGQALHADPRPARGRPVVLVALVRSGRISRSTWRQTLVAVILPALVLFVFELPNPRTLGVRYLLPSIALWIVVASPIALVVSRRLAAWPRPGARRGGRPSPCPRIPHSIAYTAPPFRPGYRVATDSNVDWGQDFSLLTTWSRGRHPYVAYFGPRGITSADIAGARPLVGLRRARIHGLGGRIGQRPHQCRRDSLSWLRAYCPVGTLGGSILLYHFTVAADGGSRAGGAGAPVCRDQSSHRVAGAAHPGRLVAGDGQASTLRRKLRSPRVKKTALKARSAG